MIVNVLCVGLASQQAWAELSSYPGRVQHAASGPAALPPWRDRYCAVPSALSGGSVRLNLRGVTEGWRIHFAPFIGIIHRQCASSSLGLCRA